MLRCSPQNIRVHWPRRGVRGVGQYTCVSIAGDVSIPSSSQVAGDPDQLRYAVSSVRGGTTIQNAVSGNLGGGVVGLTQAVTAVRGQRRGRVCSGFLQIWENCAKL